VKQKKCQPLFQVQQFDAKPNPLFPDWLTACVVFLRYSKAVKCAYCGHLNRHHWSLRRFFRIAEGFERKVAGQVVPGQSMVMTKSREEFPPLTPVCRKHIMHPQP